MGKGHVHVVSGGGHRTSNIHHNLAASHLRRNPAPLDEPGFISEELQDELNKESERKFGSDKKPSSSSSSSSTAHDDLRKRADEPQPIPDECHKGGFITAPASGSTIDALAPVAISWLPSCLPGHKTVDIHLFAPGLDHGRAYKFLNAPNTGNITLDFEPRWWEAKQGCELQLQILGHNVESFLSELPAGPVFIAKWEEPKVAPGAAVPAALDTNKINLGQTDVGAASQPSSLARGKTAVAVLIPLLILGLGGFAFFKWKRKREASKRKDWAEQVDKRMSTISTDWKSVTVAGAQAGIRSSMAASRASMAVGGNARGSFAFGNLRPQSTFDDMDEKAGVLGSEGTFDKAQRRPGVGLRNPNGLGDRAASSVYTNRTSRVSFADQTRPSMDRRTKTFQDTHVPPVPSLPARRPSTESNSSSSEDIANASYPGSGSMSPTQASGPVTLTPEDIRARIAAGRARSDSRVGSESGSGRGRSESRTEGSRSRMAERGMSEVDGDVLPALTMMRANADNDDYLLTQPTPPAATYPKPMTSITPHTSGDGSIPLSPTARTMTMSPVMHTLPMQALPASVMSPDDMLRAYAERKKSGIVQYPQPPAPSVAAPGGRTLFSGMVSPTHTGETPIPKVPQMGFAVGEYDSNFSFGQPTNAFEAPVMPAATASDTPPSPLGKRKSASNNPYFAHAQQSYQNNDAYAYDANYAAGPYAIGEADEADENRAGRGAGAYRG